MAVTSYDSALYVMEELTRVHGPDKRTMATMLMTTPDLNIVALLETMCLLWMDIPSVSRGKAAFIWPHLSPEGN